MHAEPVHIRRLTGFIFFRQQDKLGEIKDYEARAEALELEVFGATSRRKAAEEAESSLAIKQRQEDLLAKCVRTARPPSGPRLLTGSRRVRCRLLEERELMGKLCGLHLSSCGDALGKDVLGLLRDGQLVLAALHPDGLWSLAELGREAGGGPSAPLAPGDGPEDPVPLSKAARAALVPAVLLGFVSSVELQAWGCAGALGRGGGLKTRSVMDILDNLFDSAAEDTGREAGAKGGSSRAGEGDEDGSDDEEGDPTEEDAGYTPAADTFDPKTRELPPTPPRMVHMLRSALPASATRCSYRPRPVV